MHMYMWKYITDIKEWKENIDGHTCTKFVLGHAPTQVLIFVKLIFWLQKNFGT